MHLYPPLCHFLQEKAQNTPSESGRRGWGGLYMIGQPTALQRTCLKGGRDDSRGLVTHGTGWEQGQELAQQVRSGAGHAQWDHPAPSLLPLVCPWEVK